MSHDFDWRVYDRFFVPVSDEIRRKPAFFVVDQRRVVASFHENQDMGDWIGATIEEVVEQFQHQDFLLIDRAELDSTINNALDPDHYYEQLSRLREKISTSKIAPEAREHLSSGQQAQVEAKGERAVEGFREGHFFIEAFNTWWQRMFPHDFAILFRVFDSRTRDALLVFHKGKLISCRLPDFSDFHSTRPDDLSEVSRYLTERYKLPVTVLWVVRDIWESARVSANPWKVLHQAIRRKDVRVSPQRMKWKSLIAARSRLGV